jgi:hypothetical protein
VGAIVLGQPIGQLEQFGSGGTEAAHLLMNGRRDASHAGHDGVLAHVQTRTARVEHLHENLLAVEGHRRQSSSSNSTSRASGRCHPLPHSGVLAGLRVQLLNGFATPSKRRPRQQCPSSSYDHTPSFASRGPSFMPRGRARTMANSLLSG